MHLFQTRLCNARGSFQANGLFTGARSSPLHFRHLEKMRLIPTRIVSFTIPFRFIIFIEGKEREEERKRMRSVFLEGDLKCKGSSQSTKYSAVRARCSAFSNPFGTSPFEDEKQVERLRFSDLGLFVRSLLCRSYRSNDS